MVEIIPSVATLGGPGVPAGQPNVPFQIMLNEGDTAEVMTKTQGVGLTGTQVNSDEDQLSPVEQYLPRYVVLVPGTWINDFAVITREMDAEVTIDGVPIPDQSFVPTSDSFFEVARVPITDGVHVIDGGIQKFSVVIVGYDTYDSYAYLGGTGTGVINPNPQ